MTFQFVPKRKLLEFEKILIQEEVILRSILSVITNDKEEDIGVALMNIYWSNNQDVAVMEKTCVPVELERTPEEVQLFRQNSSYLFMLSEFLRLNGGEYMKKVLRPAIKHFLKKDSVHYEIDPKRIDAPENMAKHINNVTGASQFFLDTILKAVHDMPLPLREFIRRLFAASEHRFPGSGYRSIGALYFLRFVCPMIVSPKAYQLVKENKELTPAACRGLILVAKVIQSVANESTSFEKEEYMKPLTELVMRNVPGVHSYYDAIIKEEQPKGPKISSRSSCPPQYLLMIVRYLRRDAEKVRSHTLEQGGTEAMWTKLMGLVEALSPTPSKSGKLGTPTGEQAVLAAASSGGGENEHVAVQSTGSSPSVTDLQSSDENLSDRQELSRSVSPPNLRPLIASSGAPAAPMSPSKKIKKDEKDKKDKGAKIKKDKPDKNAADKRAKKPDAVEPASSPSNSPIARHPGIIRSNSNVAATASGGTTTSGGGESSDSTEDPRSSHSDQFALP